MDSPLQPRAASALGVADVEALAAAKRRLEHPGLAARVSSAIGTPVEKGLEIVQGLRGFTTGYAVPTFVVDAPGGGGKIPLYPDMIAGREGDDLLLRNYAGRIFRYPDPAPELARAARAK